MIHASPCPFIHERPKSMRHTRGKTTGKDQDKDAMSNKLLRQKTNLWYNFKWNVRWNGEKRKPDARYKTDLFLYMMVSKRKYKKAEKKKKTYKNDLLGLPL